MSFKNYNSNINSKITVKDTSEILKINKIFYGRDGEIKDFTIGESLDKSGAHGSAYSVCQDSNCDFVLKRIDLVSFVEEIEDDDDKIEEMAFFTDRFINETELQNKASLSGIASPVYLSYIIKYKELGLIMDKYEMTLNDLFLNQDLTDDEIYDFLNKTYDVIETLLCESNITHNDCQLDNFMINKNREVKIIDFGESTEVFELNLRDFQDFQNELQSMVEFHKRNYHYYINLLESNEAKQNKTNLTDDDIKRIVVDSEKKANIFYKLSTIWDDILAKRENITIERYMSTH